MKEEIPFVAGIVGALVGFATGCWLTMKATLWLTAFLPAAASVGKAFAAFGFAITIGAIGLLGASLLAMAGAFLLFFIFEILS